MKRTGAVFCFVLSLCGFFVVNAYSSQQEDFLFGNMAYRIGDEPGLKEITLVDGEYRDPLLCVYYEGDFIYGDFNRDGLKDAAVVLYESGGGSGYFLNLAFLINDGTKLVHQSSYSLGYKTFVVSLTERGGKVIVDMTVPDKREGSGGFSLHVRRTYDYVEPTKWVPMKPVPFLFGKHPRSKNRAR